MTGPIATHPSELGTPLKPGEPAETAPFKGALGEDAAEMCIFEQNGYDADRDYCIPDDESAASEGVYVSLVKNPERFTGYAGEHANSVWREIYRENCFEMQPQTSEEEEMLSRTQLGQGPAKNNLEAVFLGMNSQGQRMSGTSEAQEYNQLQLDQTCLEKRVFWRLISGMHTSVSTHLAWDYLNQTTGKWVHTRPALGLTSGSKCRSLQISGMELSPMDRKSLLQLRRRSPRGNQTILLPRLLHILFRRPKTRRHHSTKSQVPHHSGPTGGSLLRRISYVRSQ